MNNILSPSLLCYVIDAMTIRTHQQPCPRGQRHQKRRMTLREMESRFRRHTRRNVQVQLPLIRRNFQRASVQTRELINAFLMVAYALTFGTAQRLGREVLHQMKHAIGQAPNWSLRDAPPTHMSTETQTNEVRVKEDEISDTEFELNLKK